MNVLRESPAGTAPCPLCEASAPFEATAGQRPFHRCPGCGLCFVPAAFHLTPEAEQARYRLHRNTAEDAGYVAYLRPAADALERHLPAAGAGRVLDYGSGPTPVFVQMLRARGYEATGYDPYFAADTPAAGPFAAVTATETAEHFRAPASEWLRLADLLGPGGILVVMTAFSDGIADLARWHYALDCTHVALYARRTFDWIAARHKFALLETDGRRLMVFRR